MEELPSQIRDNKGHCEMAKDETSEDVKWQVQMYFSIQTRARNHPIGKYHWPVRIAGKHLRESCHRSSEMEVCRSHADNMLRTWNKESGCGREEWRLREAASPGRIGCQSW